MPGDLVFGDVEGVYFIPPALVEPVLDNADVIHVHDEWTRRKFDEGKYKSREIYGSPSDPVLKSRARGVSQKTACRDPREVPAEVSQAGNAPSNRASGCLDQRVSAACSIALV